MVISFPIFNASDNHTYKIENVLYLVDGSYRISPEQKTEYIQGGRDEIVFDYSDHHMVRFVCQGKTIRTNVYKTSNIYEDSSICEGDSVLLLPGTYQAEVILNERILFK